MAFQTVIHAQTEIQCFNFGFDIVFTCHSRAGGDP